MEMDVGELECLKDYDNILDVDTCKLAAKYMGKQYRYSEEDSNWPNGCYRNERTNLIYFNTNPTNKAHEEAKIICSLQIVNPTEAPTPTLYSTFDPTPNPTPSPTPNPTPSPTLPYCVNTD